jgi:hypothetical protein
MGFNNTSSTVQKYEIFGRFREKEKRRCTAYNFEKVNIACVMYAE